MTMAVLRVRDDVIVMQTLLWPDEVRAAGVRSLGDAESAAKPARARDGHHARRLPVGRLRPGRVRGRLLRRPSRQLVAAKIEGGEVTAGARAPRTRRARSSTCSRRCSAASSGPRPPAASRPETRPATTRPATPRPTTAEDRRRTSRRPAGRLRARPPRRRPRRRRRRPPAQSAPARKTARKSASGDDAPRKKAAS